MGWYVPSKMLRRAQAGKVCPACSIRMHHLDVVGWAGEEGEIFIHQQCAALLLDTEAEDVIHLEDSAGDSPTRGTGE